MIRAILIFILLALIYQAIRIVIHAALGAARRDDASDRRRHGAEMVQDPQCRTYIVKERAITRSVDGARLHFCSTACADAYERAHRS